ncbi:hypothetical protein PMIN03_005980 [Paraphaeosphaeria minitans]
MSDAGLSCVGRYRMGWATGLSIWHHLVIIIISRAGSAICPISILPSAPASNRIARGSRRRRSVGVQDRVVLARLWRMHISNRQALNTTPAAYTALDKTTQPVSPLTTTAETHCRFVRGAWPHPRAQHMSQPELSQYPVHTDIAGQLQWCRM